MKYQEALSIIYNAESYGVSVPYTDEMDQEEIIKLAEDMIKMGDAYEAESTGN